MLNFIRFMFQPRMFLWTLAMVLFFSPIIIFFLVMLFMIILLPITAIMGI